MSRNIRDEINRDLQIDNRSLVEECLKGDREALSLFYTRFAPKMLSLIHRYVSDPMDAEDILHDGFIIAFTRLRTLRDYDHADYWLATIMKNLSLQFLHLQDIGPILHDIPDTADTPAIDEFLDMETLESLIRELPAGYQKVFRLAVLEKKSHKEIADILGISPHSSSSQLFRARMMMQKLIKDYRTRTGAFILLLVVLSTGIYLSNSVTEPLNETYLATDTASQTRSTSSTPKTHPACQVSSVSSAASVTGTVRASAPAASVRMTPALDDTGDTEDTAVPDTITDRTREIPQEPAHKSESQPEDNTPLYADLPLPPSHGRRTTAGWSLGVGVNPGIVNFDAQLNCMDYEVSAPPADNPEDRPDEKPDRVAQTRSVSTLRGYAGVPHRNSLPISTAFLVSRRITGLVSVETGLSYTYLHTEFEGERSTADCRWHYIGIPLKVKFNLLSSRRIAVYASAGAQLDIPMYSDADVTVTNNTPDLKAGRFNSPVVWSLSAGVGASLKLSDRFEIFLEPTLQYRFDHDYTVPNIWTDNPFGFSLPIGLRFNM